jgi:hypothetical protein
MVTGVLFITALMVAFAIGSICEKIIPERVWKKVFKLFGFE